MRYTQKYALVHFIHPIELNVEFDMSDWPLHVTLADVFAIDRPGTAIDAKLHRLLSNYPAVETYATENTKLSNTPVVLVDNNEMLLRLHFQIITLLIENGARFNNPEFTRDGYVPHSTVQKQGNILQGESVRIDSLTLVDMFPANNWKRGRVVADFKLS